MPRTILVLLVAGMIGVSFPVLSQAGKEDVVSPSETPSVSEGTARGAISPSVGMPDEESYLIGPGDVLDISVWKDEALTRSCVVRPDGAISFPLIGEVQATGRTVSELKAEIEQRIDRYVPGATLSLEVKQINSMIIYVIGKVNSPGRFIMNANIDVLQALATAGGLNVFAKRSKIKIFRHGKSGTIIFPFDYDEVISGKLIEQNIRLLRGDVVVIP